MSVWAFVLYLLIIALTGLGVGWLWFSVCGWDKLFNCRNYKPLVVVIPITFALALLFIGFPVRTETKPVVVPAPVVEKKTTKKNTKKPKPVKLQKEKTEDSEQQNDSENRDEIPSSDDRWDNE